MDTNTMDLDLIQHTLERSEDITTPGEHLLCGMAIQLLDHLRDLRDRVETLEQLARQAEEDHGRMLQRVAAIERSREVFATQDLPRLETRIETLEEGQ